MLANVFQRSNREASRRVCAPLCRRNLFKYHKKNVFWLQIPFLWLLFPLPAATAAALNGALILTPLSKLLCRRFQRREIALASLIYVKTRFFSCLTRAKRRYPKPFSNSYLFLRRFVVVGWVNPYSMCVDLELEQLRQLSGKL